MSVTIDKSPAAGSASNSAGGAQGVTLAETLCTLVELFNAAYQRYRDTSTGSLAEEVAIEHIYGLADRLATATERRT